MGAFDALIAAAEGGLRGGARKIAHALPEGVFGALERSRLGSMSRGGGLATMPFHTPSEAVPLLAMRGARRGIESDVDPRLVMGGAGLAAFPTGAGAATMLDRLNTVEQPLRRAGASAAHEDQRETSIGDAQDMKIAALRATMRGMRPEDVADSDPALARAMQELQGAPSGGLPSRQTRGGVPFGAL